VAQRNHQSELTDQIEKTLRAIPGQRLSFSQPIKMRLDEMDSGVRADVAVKVFGDDLEVLKKKAAHVEKFSRRSMAARMSTPNRSRPARAAGRGQRQGAGPLRLSARAVLDLIESVGSKPLGDVVEGQLRFPLAIRLPERWRADPEAIKALLIAAPSGERVPLARVARVQTVEARRRSRASGPAPRGGDGERAWPRPGQLHCRGPPPGGQRGATAARGALPHRMGRTICPL